MWTAIAVMVEFSSVHNVVSSRPTVNSAVCWPDNTETAWVYIVAVACSCIGVAVRDDVWWCPRVGRWLRQWLSHGLYGNAGNWLCSLCGSLLARWRYRYGIGLAIYRSWVRVLPRHHCTVALGKLLTPVCLCYQTVPVKGWWLTEAGKVTVGLATHWPRVTDFVVHPPTGSRLT